MSDKTPNKYPGTCTLCGNNVPAGAGFRFRENGKWAVTHNNCEDAGEDTVTVEPDFEDIIAINFGTDSGSDDEAAPSLDDIYEHPVVKELTKQLDDLLSPAGVSATCAADRLAKRAGGDVHAIDHVSMLVRSAPVFS